MGSNATTLVPRDAKNQEALAAQYHVMNYVNTHIFVRRLVSKKRRRLLFAGFDLDMSYINDRILAMSFPAERMKAIYRNPMWQVKEVLEMKHRGHYKVYNLCIEEDYDPSHFKGLVERYPFDDNHVPSLPLVKEFCESVHCWLASHSKNTAVVHCMAGKGRTGLMVSCYLVYTGMQAEEALQVYADKRTTNNLGVTIPSQRRYVSYWQRTLSYPEGYPPEVNIPTPTTREVQRIRLSNTKNIGIVFFIVSQMQEVPEQRYRPSIETCRSYCRKVENGGLGRVNSRPCSISSFIEEDEEDEEEHNFLDSYFEKQIQVNGDVCITFFEKKIGNRLFYVSFNTAFIEDSKLQFSLSELDKVGGKGKAIAGEEFRVELFFGPALSGGDVSGGDVSGGDVSGGDGLNFDW